ncbi:MAG: 3-hydroxyacyl-CoA dehydrogenase NAD-binding domain-containing protein [Actinomycetota bacterium]|nr:3-hydroxyacyl-CoA dehydrogenase NAD-binding domain-containing protein [Actinomycetota bacterium]
MSNNPYPVLAVAGSGAIATGLAALASATSEQVWLLARSDASAERAATAIEKACSRIDGADSARVRATTEQTDLAPASMIVEAIVEDHSAKAELLAGLAAVAPGADLSTTTSSLSVTELGLACGHPERLIGLHVFNPVPVMDLVEVCLPAAVDPGVGERVARWCEAAGKTAVPVPDTPGFVVNRLLFPYLFDAVRFQETSGMPAKNVDTCMTLGVAHPMGPLALLDLIGLDVAVAIGGALHSESGNDQHLAPETVLSKVEAGHLGRKAGRGFYDYG